MNGTLHYSDQIDTPKALYRPVSYTLVFVLEYFLRTTNSSRLVIKRMYIDNTTGTGYDPQSTH